MLGEGAGAIPGDADLFRRPDADLSHGTGGVAAGQGKRLLGSEGSKWASNQERTSSGRAYPCRALEAGMETISFQVNERACPESGGEKNTSLYHYMPEDFLS